MCEYRHAQIAVRLFDHWLITYCTSSIHTLPWVYAKVLFRIKSLSQRISILKDAVTRATRTPPETTRCCLQCNTMALS